MPYIEGFVAAVPTANREVYIEHAKQGAEYFKNLGATRVTECWGDDVPRGEVTDFFRATQAKDDETGRLQLDRVSGQGDPRRREREDERRPRGDADGDALRRQPDVLGWRHAEPALGDRPRAREPGAGGSPDDDARRHRHRLGVAALRKDYVGSTTTTTGTAISTRSATWRSTVRFYNGQSGRVGHGEAPARPQCDRGVKHGLVGRGVLLDVPRLRGVPGWSPGEHVFREDLEAAEREQDVTREGDILLVRTGHSRRLGARAWDTTTAKAGLHPPRCRSSPSAGSPRSGRTGTATPRRAAPRGRVPDPRAGAQRDGGPPARLPPVRGPRRALREDGRWEFLFAASPRESSAAPDRRSTRSRSSDAPAQALRDVAG